MRRFLLALAILSVLWVGAAPALSEDLAAPAAAATVHSVVPDQIVITPVRWVYQYPAWYWVGPYTHSGPVYYDPYYAGRRFGYPDTRQF